MSVGEAILCLATVLIGLPLFVRFMCGQRHPDEWEATTFRWNAEDDRLSGCARGADAAAGADWGNVGAGVSRAGRGGLQMPLSHSLSDNR